MIGSKEERPSFLKKSSKKLLLLVAYIGPACVAGSAVAEPVPFVGCAADGQTGPVAAPAASPRSLSLPPDLASRVALYAATGLAVLAPRGWACFEIYGAGGARLTVTPHPLTSAVAFGPNDKLHGPAVIVEHLGGSTSGRFDVAQIVARLFPAARAYVKQVAAEGLRPDAGYSFAPFPADHLTRLSRSATMYLTPAGQIGLGTNGKLAPDRDPITGAVIWLPDQDNDLIKLDVRLAPEDENLRQAIITDALHHPY